jgi:hypothetical protein
MMQVLWWMLLAILCHRVHPLQWKIRLADSAELETRKL